MKQPLTPNLSSLNCECWARASPRKFGHKGYLFIFFVQIKIPDNQLIVRDFRWCPGRDSNPHTSRHTHLKRARLPIPPPGHFGLATAKVILFFNTQAFYSKKVIKFYFSIDELIELLAAAVSMLAAVKTLGSCRTLFSHAKSQSRKVFWGCRILFPFPISHFSFLISHF